MKLKLPVWGLIWSVALFFFGLEGKAQSQNQLRYQTTFNPSTQRFTVWVVPQYNTPNANNPDTDERGATALVTLKVPTTFTISNIQNIRGSWNTNPLKLGPGIQSEFTGQGLDPAFHYYAIDKSATETNYGPFSNGVPVALFSFQGNGTQGNVSILAQNDPFITISDTQLSLNVAPSFYSLSGQPAGGNQVQLQQFSGAQGNPANFIQAADDVFFGAPGIPANQSVLTNDDFNGTSASVSQVSVSIVGTPANGTAVVNANGTISFTPSTGVSGTGSYTYRICDLQNPTVCDEATVTVQMAQNKIQYQTTYNPVTQRYTVWVVPLYNTPNANNPDVNERGATAQVTLKVPTAFTISDIQNINGIWDNNPTKLGPGIQPIFNGQGLDPNTNYYVIGKSSSQTIYGPFSTGVPVPLFSFTGNCAPGGVGVIQSNDPFVNVADTQGGLNVAPSFYSLSGQTPGGNSIPLEQYIGPLGNAANCILATDDAVTGVPGVASDHNVLANDTYNGGVPTSSQVTVSIVGTPLNGSAVVNPNGTVSFTPTPGFTGTAGYTYRICDILNPTVCEDATVTVTVSCGTVTTPTVSTPVVYCVGQTAVALTATAPAGSTLRWYTAAIGGTFTTTAPTPTTSASGTTSFFVSSITAGGCESSRVEIQVTVNPIPTVPVVPAAPAYCVGQTPTALTATPSAGTTLRWYTVATGGVSSSVAPTPSTSTAGTQSFWVSSFNSTTGCESNRVQIDVTVQGIPGVPTVVSPVAYCVGQSATALSATAPSGATLRWYTTSTGGVFTTSAPTPNTTGAGTTSFYVSSVNAGGCESARVEIQVTVTALPNAPTVTSPVNYCVGQSALQLTATPAAGMSLRWYSSSTGGTGSAVAPTPSTSTAGTQTFWVSSFNSSTGCESVRTPLDVVVSAIPATPSFTSPINYCVGQSAVALSATAPAGSTLRWYTTSFGGTFTTTAPTPSTTTAGTTSFFVSSINAAGCESARVEIQVVVSPAPTVPVVPVAPTYCVGQTALALSATAASGTSLRWYTTATGGTGSATAPTPSTSVAGTQSFWVSSFNSSSGCESNRVQINVVVSTAPTVPTVLSPVNYCVGQSPVALSATGPLGTTLRWYTTAVGGTFTTTAPTPSTASAGTTSFFVSSVNAGGCESARVEIQVIVNPLPTTPLIGATATYCLGQTPTALTATPASGTSLRWYTTATGGVGSATAPTPTTNTAGTQSFWVSSFNSSTGCESNRVQVDVIVQAIANVPTVLSPVTYCAGQTAVALSATPPAGATLRWYTTSTGGTFSTTAPTPNTSVVGTTSFFVSSVVGGGCESARVEIQVTVSPLPTAPTGTTPITYCVGQSASALTATPPSGMSLRWYTTATGGVGSTTAPVPTTNTAGTQSFWVTSFNSSTGCESSRTRLDVIVSNFPSAPTVTTPVALCLNQVASPLSATVGAGFTAVWYTTATGGTGSITAPTPATNVAGSQSFWVSARNPSTLCESPRVLVTVNVTDCRSVQAVNDNLLLFKNTTNFVNVLQNDQILNGISPLVAQTTLVSLPQFGNATLNAAGVLTYTPTSPTFVGRDELRYRICDSGSPAVCSEAIVSILVSDAPQVGANNPPVALNDVFLGPINTSIQSSVSLNDQDPDIGQSLTFSVLTSPPTGSLTFQTNGQFVYQPVTGFTGSVSFTYRVCDNGSPIKCDQANVQMLIGTTVPSGNLPPIASDDYLRIRPGQTLPLNVLTNDRDPEGGLLATQTTFLLNPTRGTATLTSAGQLSYTPQSGFVGVDQIVYRVCDAGSPAQCSQASIWIEIMDSRVILTSKVFLQGALLGVTASNGIMRDDLRVKGLIPTTSPYSGITSISSVNPVAPSVFSVTGTNAIVDWVFIELRSSVDPSIVLDSRPALVQRDGDVVDTDGVSPVVFQTAQTNSYYVAIKHRNHNGVMTGSPIALGTAPNLVDFTLSSTPTWVPVVVNINQPQVVVNQGRALWAGNVLRDDRIVYQGSGNDIDPLYQRLINNPGNVLYTPFYKVRGYLVDDVNLDGEVIFQGSANDIEFIYLNVVSNHSGNILRQNSFVIRQQLP